MHSGVFGGAVFEPLTDLVLLSECIKTFSQKPLNDKFCYAVSKLVSPKGEILIPGVKELVAPVTNDERQKFEAIHFQMKVGPSRYSFPWSKSDTLDPRTCMTLLAAMAHSPTTPSQP